MFLCKYQRTKDGKRHTYFALVESRRTERGPRPQIVAHPGELTEDQAHRWQRTAVFHARHDEGHELPLFVEDHAPAATEDDDAGATTHDPDVVRIRQGKVGWTNARAFGDVWLGWQLRRKLELNRIVDRHIQRGRETVSPATMVAIEVISRLCIGQGGETSEFGLAEHGYRRTALEDLLGVPDDFVTKDRLYRTLDALQQAKAPIERGLTHQLDELFSLQFDLLLCDLTSNFFEGLMEDNTPAKRGYSRDHRPDCKQIVLAMVVTPDGFPVYHEVFAGNTNDVIAFPTIVETMKSRCGTARRVFRWLVAKGLIEATVLDSLGALEPLKRGRSAARDTQPIGPVPDAHIWAVHAECPATMQAMIELQLVTGARPGEIVTMRPIDLAMGARGVDVHAGATQNEIPRPAA